MFAWYFVWYLSEIWMIFLDIRMIYRVIFRALFMPFFMPSIQKSAFWQMAEPKAARRQRIGSPFFKLFLCFSCLFVSFVFIRVFSPHAKLTSNRWGRASRSPESGVSLPRHARLTAETSKSRRWDTNVAWLRHPCRTAETMMSTSQGNRVLPHAYGQVCQPSDGHLWAYTVTMQIACQRRASQEEDQHKSRRNITQISRKYNTNITQISLGNILISA